MCETSGQNFQAPKLADDGLCVNTKCQARGTVDCPLIKTLAELGQENAKRILNGEPVLS